jgi:OOP family OmpA-OmpF porin
MKRHQRAIELLGFLILAAGGAAFAQEDSQGCKDHPVFNRMQNFYITGCKEQKYDEVDFRNEEGKRSKVAGKVYELDYAIKEGLTPPSALQVIKNYENAIKKVGGVKVYQEESYEIWLKLAKAGKTFWVYVDSWHGGGKGETYGMTIVEQEAMAQEVVADASALISDIQAMGHAPVYGIHFDFDEADIKPESEPAIREIARLLTQNEGLKLHLVGHTDNVGSMEYNMKLSNARAAAVMGKLVTEYKISPERLRAFGVGALAPVASNRTEEGRAKNRRVELVEQ